MRFYVNEEVSGGLKGFVWNQSGTLKLRDSVENESISLTGEETITNSTFKACGNRIYYLGADENNAQNIFCITKQNGGWIFTCSGDCTDRTDYKF